MAIKVRFAIAMVTMLKLLGYSKSSKILDTKNNSVIHLKLKQAERLIVRMFPQRKWLATKATIILKGEHS